MDASKEQYQLATTVKSKLSNASDVRDNWRYNALECLQEFFSIVSFPVKRMFAYLTHSFQIRVSNSTGWVNWVINIFLKAITPKHCYNVVWRNFEWIGRFRHGPRDPWVWFFTPSTVFKLVHLKVYFYQSAMSWEKHLEKIWNVIHPQQKL